MRIRRRAQRSGDARYATGALMLAIRVARRAENYLYARRLARMLLHEDVSSGTRWQMANIEGELALQHELAGRKAKALECLRNAERLFGDAADAATTAGDEKEERSCRRWAEWAQRRIRGLEDASGPRLIDRTPKS